MPCHGGREITDLVKNSNNIKMEKINSRNSGSRRWQWEIEAAELVAMKYSGAAK